MTERAYKKDLEILNVVSFASCDVDRVCLPNRLK